MALHTGLAQQRDDDYLGPPFNRIARLLSARWSGSPRRSRAQQLRRFREQLGCWIRCQVFFYERVIRGRTKQDEAVLVTLGHPSIVAADGYLDEFHRCRPLRLLALDGHQVRGGGPVPAAPGDLPPASRPPHRFLSLSPSKFQSAGPSASSNKAYLVAARHIRLVRWAAINSRPQLSFSNYAVAVALIELFTCRSSLHRIHATL